MVKIWLLVSLLLLALDARENPFFPSEGEKDIPITSNLETEIPPLKRVTMTLPAQARILQSVTISYKNLDGSIDTQTIYLENSVDWHLPLFISQSYQPDTQKVSATPMASTAVKKAIKVEAVKKVEIKDYKKIASIEYADFFVLDNSLKVVTKDKMLRNFLLVHPHRIVMDFQRDSSMKSYDMDTTNGIFTRIRIGNHDGYYRVVVELDGYYRYKLKNMDDSYMFDMK